VNKYELKEIIIECLESVLEEGPKKELVKKVAKGAKNYVTGKTAKKHYRKAIKHAKKATDAQGKDITKAIKNTDPSDMGFTTGFKIGKKSTSGNKFKKYARKSGKAELKGHATNPIFGAIGITALTKKLQAKRGKMKDPEKARKQKVIDDKKIDALRRKKERK